MLRPYIKSDKDKLVEIFNLNVPKYFDPKELNDFIHYLEIKSETYLTIENKNKVIGGIGYEIRDSDKSGRINWMFLHPDFSGVGLGRNAVEQCLIILKSNPAVGLLKVRTSQLVYEFFEKLGYKLIHTEKNYWAEGLDLYEMEMTRN